MASARLRRRCNEASSRMPQDFGADRLLEARARRPEYDSGEKALLREDRAATPESYFGLGQTSAGIWPEFGWQTLSSSKENRGTEFRTARPTGGSEVENRHYEDLTRAPRDVRTGADGDSATPIEEGGCI